MVVLHHLLDSSCVQNQLFERFLSDHEASLMLVQKLSEQWKIHLFISEDERGIDQHFQPSLYKNY